MVVMVRPEASPIMIGPGRSGLPLLCVSGPSFHLADSRADGSPVTAPTNARSAWQPQCRHQAKP